MNANNPEEPGSKSSSFPVNRFTSLSPEDDNGHGAKPIVSEMIGGPYEGMVCCRVLGGFFINGVMTTQSNNGDSLVGNMLMPNNLNLSNGDKSYRYVRYCNEDFGETWYMWEGIKV